MLDENHPGEQQQASGSALVLRRDEDAAAATTGHTIATAVISCDGTALKKCATGWGATRNLAQALLAGVGATLELAGLPCLLEEADLRNAPEKVLGRIPGMVKEKDVDATVYPLLPSAKNGRRTVAAWASFWLEGIYSQSAEDSLRVLPGLSRWLLVMSRAGVRAVRHTSTVASLALVEALGLKMRHLQERIDANHHLTLVIDGKKNAQAAALKAAKESMEAQQTALSAIRGELVAAIVPRRSRDINDDVRQHVLCEVDKQLKQDPEALFEPVWSEQVLGLLSDPVADVRLQALTTLSRCCRSFKKTVKRRKQLKALAEQCVPQLVDRTSDKDARVACLALKCIRMPLMVEVLSNENFDNIADLVVGARDASVREEAALFVDAHIFEAPGICQKRVQAKPCRGLKMLQAPAAEAAKESEMVATALTAVTNEGATSSTALHARTQPDERLDGSLPMLLEYLEQYLDDKLRLTERVVAAFWTHAPVLTQWTRMLSMLMDPSAAQTAKRRLCLLYLIEASLRRASADCKSAKLTEREGGLGHMQTATQEILPHLASMLEQCRSVEAEVLLVSHIGKFLAEFAACRKDARILLDQQPLCQELRRVILSSTSLEIVKHSTDIFIALTQLAASTQAEFLSLAKEVHAKCRKLLEDYTLETADGESQLLLQNHMASILVMSNRGVDMTFGNEDMLTCVRNLLQCRLQWMESRKSQKAAADAAGEVAPPQPPAGVPGVRLTVLLVAVAAVAATWHVRMGAWNQSVASQEAAEPLHAQSPATRQAEADVAEMLQVISDKPVVRTGLVKEVLELRQTLVRLIWSDRSPIVKFLAYNIYMMLLQLATGVSDVMSLEHPQDVAYRGAAGLFHVTLPEDHHRVLWQYLNGVYASAAVEEEEGTEAAFDADGCYFEPGNVTPGVGTLTSAWYLVERLIEGRGHGDEEEEINIRPQHLVLFAVVASQAIVDCEVEDVYAGPLAQLLLTQCDRSRPEVLRDVSTRLLRRLREFAKCGDEFGHLYFRMQAESIASVFECLGLDAAQALCTVFTSHWGPQPVKSLEKPLWLGLRRAALESVTPNGDHLPLLEVFAFWMRSDEFVPAAVRQELKKALLERCRAVGIKQAKENPHVASFLLRASSRTARRAAVVQMEAAEMDVGSSQKRRPRSPSPLPVSRPDPETTRRTSPGSGDRKRPRQSVSSPPRSEGRGAATQSTGVSSAVESTGRRRLRRKTMPCAAVGMSP
mmetsp:Transcript_6608/g.11493  ORF Transcript_6608/g.11493 Transcript_6608/m.11493 type:complete len:1228 (-) Transcript_6608:35-3718(-)